MPAQESGDVANRTVFVVDDDVDLAAGLVMLLSVNGYAATSFPSAEAFLASNDILSWGCGLVDVQMPGIDGLTLAERLQVAGAPPPGLVIMTGHASLAVERRAAAAGVALVLAKPLDTSEMLAAVKQVCGG